MADPQNPASIKVFVDSAIAPPGYGPAPSGFLPVLAGMIRQMGSDGQVDTAQRQTDGTFKANINQFLVPYASGGWPADPLAGTPGHGPPFPLIP